MSLLPDSRPDSTPSPLAHLALFYYFLTVYQAVQEVKLHLHNNEVCYPGFYLAILYVTLNISILFELGSLRGGTFSSDFSLTETVHTITGHSFQDRTCSTPKE